MAPGGRGGQVAAVPMADAASMIVIAHTPHLGDPVLNSGSVVKAENFVEG
jgi:hypothetical protein